MEDEFMRFKYGKIVNIWMLKVKLLIFAKYISVWSRIKATINIFGNNNGQ